MDINQANRQCCDLDIRDYVTNKPWMFADFCNTTTAGFSSDPVYALKKGARNIKFDNPLDGTVSCTFQVHPFRIYSLYSDGTIEDTATIPVRKTIAATAEGEIAVTDTPVPGTVFVYNERDIGGEVIDGTFASGKFTATQNGDIAVGSKYEICYLTTKTTGKGSTVRKISFNDSKVPKNYRITMETLDKDENGEFIPVLITAYKACPQRSMDLSFSSTGDPAEITITFDALKDDEGNVLDIVEILE
ncbi:MAG: hypothetical protein LBE23_05900 [Vagococcus sp.]|jgi:hypothetical protein|nr:hypothetical protein [Vagococcus sp.]